MKLREIFDSLTYGELSQLNIGGAKEGFIDDSNYDRMLTHVNLGLTALHRRFLLKEGSLALALTPGLYLYDLHSDHAISTEGIGLGLDLLELDGEIPVVDTSTPEDAQYILDDLRAPFQDNLIKVERVKTAAGVELGLNDLSDHYAVRTLKANRLLVPRAIVDGDSGLPACYKTSLLEVFYRANHPFIAPGAGLYDANQVEIDLPQTHVEALLYFIASRTHNPLGAANGFHAGSDYYAKFLAACAELENQGLAIDQGSSDDKLRSRGWA